MTGALPASALPSPLEEAAAGIDRCAVWALEMEVRLFPKAGLVSFVDTGSHDDMDAGTFRRSAAALKGYFGRMAEAGARGAPFAEMKSLGMAAEARMFAATGGINTHRGAVFSLGLLAAATGRQGTPATDSAVARSRDLCRAVALWGPDILAARPSVDASHGAQVRARYGAAGAREQAAAGFPVLRNHALPAFDAVFDRGGDVERAGLQAFYATIAVLEDNNLLHRAGPDGLAFAQGAARDFLARGGMLAADGYGRARALHEAFVARRLSPGGAADLVAAVLFLAAVTGRVPPRTFAWP
ncbi:triphosphoribosyl-dephospho-CoA synthase MdcB [Ancylobacter sp. MQZ15Z-1]|uniref:Probable 2-(5''-triphosphoribosyl)-3'-dephosphocoenzyme-A synthase n=1 Tax=Ancylobacter mangrovi TaxID=2972472 RepID=A0A9X2T3K9_9HYPH|nr:triphosphoribosyl-dephospho-CoA synthase MdcB [Ancylobacter mangrovi]MCS0497242.1 triphosphoribosyl-dephospho-CoA synthase MdcB [Ancylobacter mangrovi]